MLIFCSDIAANSAIENCDSSFGAISSSECAAVNGRDTMILYSCLAVVIEIAIVNYDFRAIIILNRIQSA